MKGLGWYIYIDMDHRSDEITRVGTGIEIDIPTRNEHEYEYEYEC